MRAMPPIHPAAILFPMLPPDELQALADDIKTNGLQQPIVMFGAQLLDGRNRWKACELAGVEPKVRDWSGESPTAFVISVNVKRRHLTPGQLAVVAVEALPLFEEEAKKRQGKRSDISPKLGESERGKAAEKAAEAVGASRSYVEQVKAIREVAPELVEKIKTGEIKITEAARQVKRDEVSRAVEPLPSSRYRVIYADPPWQYNDSRVGLADFSATAAEDHYPTMPTVDICALPVRELADDNAVLFCWATFPLLTDAMEVVRAWGFQYKTAFVWAKGRPNFGHYHNANAELLIVATRGSCTPDADKRESQVQAIERTARHSEKPEEFRAMIDRLYSRGRAIELFRRGEKIKTSVREWDIWGNEAKAAS
jgi:N6-adenosine-specific RNA methylase IME4